MEGHDERNQNPIFSKRLRAGRRRTYFFDVRQTKSDDYYLTITESKKKFNDDGYERHKVFIYKEDFNKFVNALQDAVDHIKHELMPEYDFDEFHRKSETFLDGEKVDGPDMDENGNVIEKPQHATEQSTETTTEAEPAAESTETIEEATDENVDDDELKWD